jgi:gluconokinase
MILILMGVSGSGKTVVGQMLSGALGWDFCDTDLLHSHANVEKMRRGIPLNDEERAPWLKAVRGRISEYLARQENAIIACSALKASYREFLIVSDAVKLVYLKGSFQLINERLQARSGHFFNPKLLQSQFDALEEPRDALIVDVAPSPRVIVDTITSKLKLKRDPKAVNNS